MNVNDANSRIRSWVGGPTGSSPKLFSLDGKAAGLLHSLRQLLPHLLPRRVGRQVEAVEAGVRLGQVLRGRLDEVQREEPRPRRPRRALEGLEALERHPRGARHELQEARAHLLRVVLDDAPEPLHHRRLRVAVLQPRVVLPVGDVDLADAT